MIVKHLDITDDDYADEKERANIVKMLKKTHGGAVATQCFRLDNEAECKELLMEKGSWEYLANAHFQAIMQLEANGF